MHTRQLLIALALQFFFCSIAISQSKRISNIYLAEKFSFYTNPDASLNHQNYFDNMSAIMGIDAQSKMILKHEIAGKNGYVHYKYQQHHGGIPIFGNTYILHEQDGKVVKTNGRYSPHIDVDLNPSIDAEVALKLAQHAMRALTYEEHVQTSELYLIDPAFPKTSESLQLAYQVDLQSIVPFDKKRFFVNAHTGEIISQFPLILLEGVPSTAKTKYYGTQNIITDSVGPQQYVLHDPTRGEGITIYSPTGENYTSTSSDWDLTNELKDEVALDAHYCTQQFYDLLLEDFDWQGLDGSGKEMIVNVHNNGAGSVNAFWNGESSNYGDGNCLYGPLTTLEVVGHEFMHGVIDYTSNLIYSGESGAINESMADMLGKALEYKSDAANFSWDLGHSFHLSPDAEPFRVMNDPTSVEMPGFYKGEFWFDGAGVHTNSAVGNLWYVMLVDGRSGTNENGIDFNVPALGMDKASQIAFLTNKSYLTESSDYPEFYELSLLATEELFGPGSPEIAAVEEAWKAVGLPVIFSGSGFDLSVTQPYFYDRRCGLNEFFPISIDVTNTGGTTYLPSMGAVLRLTVFNGSVSPYTQIISDTIQPGEVLTIDIDDWLTSDQPDFLDVDIELELNDDDPDNNTSYLPFRIYEHTYADLRLSMSFLTPACFSTELETFFRIYNNTCDPIPAGNTYNLTIEDANGNLLWSDEYTLTDDHPPFRTRFAIYNLDLGIDPSAELNFHVEFADDPDTSNNDDTEEAPFIVTIDGDYINQFQGEFALDNTIDYDVLNPSAIASFQGESYFGSTGFFTDPEDFDSCPEFEDNFNNSGFGSGNNGTIRTCLDFTGADSPYMSFDLVQLRNSFAVADNYQYSSMLQAKWTGTEDGQDIIYGQLEGLTQHYDYALPTDFKGEMVFTFYTELGDYDFFNESPDYDYDVVLMDNLQFRSDFTNTTELENGKSIQVSPNPANDLLFIRSENMLSSVELRSINGQLLKQENINSNAFDFMINEFENGVYLLRLQDVDGTWAVKKVVKMK